MTRWPGFRRLLARGNRWGLACVMTVGLVLASLAAAAIPACGVRDDVPTVSAPSASIDVAAADAHEVGQNDCMPDAVLIAAVEAAPRLVRHRRNPYPTVAPEGVSKSAVHGPPRRLILSTPTISL